MSDPTDLAAFLDHAWQRLSRGVADRRSPARYPVFATVSPDGWPEARTVALRAARRSEATVDVHTDLASAKVSSLRSNPRAQLHIWDEKPRLQIRLFARVDILAGPEVGAIWAKVPDASRAAYGKSPAQGDPIDEPYAFSEMRAQASFTVLRCQLERIDLVELGTLHRRADYRAENGWVGQWLVP